MCCGEIFKMKNFCICLVLIPLLFASLLFVSCEDTTWIWDSAEKKAAKKAKFSEKVEFTDVWKEMMEKDLKYKFYLLSIKYDISSDSFVQNMSDYAMRYDKQYQIIEYMNNNDSKSDDFVSLLKKEKLIDIDELNLMSKVHGIPLKTIASIIYDYSIWEASERCEGGSNY